jgi:hypothetical protein
VKNANEYIATAVGTNFINKDNYAVANSKKVFVEDYTGMKCPNCPPAATELENLVAAYSGSVIGLAVHAGGFAKPLGTYTADYRTSAGDAWDAATGSGGFGISLAGNPNGMVNRREFPALTHIKGYSSWNNYITPYLATPQEIKLMVNTEYDPDVRALNVTVKGYFKKAFTDNIFVSVILSEDSIIGKQKDGGADVTNYVFMHMLRGDINGAWGDTLKKAPVAINDSITKKYSNFALNPAFNDKHLTVIAFAYNKTTREVIQVEKVKIR